MERTAEQERYYRVINTAWTFMKDHAETVQDWAAFCADMKQLVFKQPEEDQKLLRGIFTAFENDLVDRSKNNG